MQDVKTPISDSYHHYLIESLKDPQEAAAYLEVALEEGEDQPQLLKKVITNIIEAQSHLEQSFDVDKMNREKVNKILTSITCAEIYTFVELLNILGFKISIQVKETEIESDAE
ncbi:MAG: DNA-binding protein [Planktothrix sp.]